jgi:hypothetical protein
MDAAFFYSMVGENRALAHEWLNECDRRYLYDRYAVLMVEAAVLLIDGELHEAASKAQQSACLLPRAQFPGFALAAKDWLDIILARAQAKARDINSDAIPLTPTQPV